ncbi:MAG: NUDIX domain-containing protein [Patescibacteria group bacterium]|nr:NUDIX domain-containing protein [Patescibacteria group bacterium]MCL5432188.1 NUDIX domain-containing protein [Patescibacteria group bacterium]
MDKLEQKVLVVPTNKLFPDGVWEGFRPIDDFQTVFGLINRYGEYKRRAEVEDDPSWKQIIPQVILIAQNQVFVHRIPVTGSEDRLHDLWPIFLGGHVEEGDVDIGKAAEREFNEETRYLGTVLKREFVGVVNLQTNQVNMVHAGLVWAYLGDRAIFEDSGDEGVIEGKFVTWDEAEKLIERMSFWSKEAFPALRERYGRMKIHEG